jgi:hypothetical protein
MKGLDMMDFKRLVSTTRDARWLARQMFAANASPRSRPWFAAEQ